MQNRDPGRINLSGQPETDDNAIVMDDKDAGHVFKAILDVSGDAIAVSDPQGHLVYANSTLKRLVGDNAIGSLTYGGPGAVGGVQDLFTQETLEKQNYSWRPFYHHISFPIETSHGVYYGSIIHDAEGVLDAEESYSALVEYSLQGFCIYLHQARRLVKVNQALADIVGYTIPELLSFDLSQLFAQIVHPDDAGAVEANLLMHIEWKDKPTRFEFKCIRKNGEIIWVEAHLNSVDYGSDRAIHVGLIDISDRKQAEELKRYRELLNNMMEGVMILDSELRIVEVNDIVLKRMGIEPKMVINKPVEELFPPSAGKNIDVFFEAAKERKEGLFEVELYLGEKEKLLLEVSTRPIVYRNKDCFLCVSREKTEMRILQDQLILAERLAATGKLATSIAHEINSPLQAISFLLENLRSKKVDDSECHQDLDLLTKAFDGIRETVQHLLDLNRPGTQDMQPININTIVEQTTALVRGSLNQKNIAIKLRLSKSIPMITGSPQQLSQVLLNLINNAVDAMTTVNPEKLHEISITTTKQNDTVMVRFADTGPGILPEDIPHIFQPFMTHGKSGGVGVGLSVCQRILQDHNGTISVHNASRGGAVFELVLPIA